MQPHATQKAINFQNHAYWIIRQQRDSNVRNGQKPPESEAVTKGNLRMFGTPRHGSTSAKLFADSTTPLPSNIGPFYRQGRKVHPFCSPTCQELLPQGELARYYIIERLGCKCGASGEWRGREGQRLTGTVKPRYNDIDFALFY